MNGHEDARCPSGKRLEGKGLAIRIAQGIKGMVLAQAYIVVKSAGFAMRVTRLDGVPRSGFSVSNDADISKELVSVDVLDGVVRSAWVK